MTIFSIAPVSERPEETLVDWSVREVLINSETEKTHHLVGYIPLDCYGRVTSKIQAFDQSKMLIKTKSGRIYYLHGAPGSHPDAEYVWRRWTAINDAQDEIDVTNHYWHSNQNT
jgi:ATP-dependent Lon protease